MKTVYGVPVPRGVQKDWTACEMRIDAMAERLRNYRVPEDWGRPVKCVGWHDRFLRFRLFVAHYPNGRSALVRIDANGKWKTSFGEVG